MEFTDTLQNVGDDVSGMTLRLGKLEEFQVEKATIQDLQTRLTRAQSQLGQLETKVDTAQSDAVKLSDLSALDAKLSERLAADFKASLQQVQNDIGGKLESLQAAFDGTIGGLREDFSGSMAAVSTELGARIDAKADGRQISRLATDLQNLKRANVTLKGRIDGLDSEWQVIRPPRPFP